MEMTLPTVLTIFLIGFLINRHRSVLIAVAAAVFLGVLSAQGWLGTLVHNLAEVYQNITT